MEADAWILMFGLALAIVACVVAVVWGVVRGLGTTMSLGNETAVREALGRQRLLDQERDRRAG